MNCYEITSIIGVIYLTLFVIFFIGMCIFILQMRQKYDIVISNLLDRLMSRNFETYIQAELAREERRNGKTPEEIYEEQERGIPV